MPALMLAVAVTAASAHEFKPTWGYAFVDDAPFNDPDAGGALLGSTRVFPRGFIRDVRPPDDRDVRMTVHVFTHGTGNPPYSYFVNEGDFVNAGFNRRVDISPLEVSYLRYDFCRFNPSNGVIVSCEPFHYIGRPSPPVQTPTPPPGGGGGSPSPPGPVDQDGDGHDATKDCSDQNAIVHPGATEVPGNGIDDDCSGDDAPGRLAATIQYDWAKRGGRSRATRLVVSEAPPGTRVDLICRGKHCPFDRKTTGVNAKGKAALLKYLQRWLRPRMTIDVRVTLPNWIGKVWRFRVRRSDTPSMQRLCLPPGATKPGDC